MKIRLLLITVLLSIFFWAGAQVSVQDSVTHKNDTIDMDKWLDKVAENSKNHTPVDSVVTKSYDTPHVQISEYYILNTVKDAKLSAIDSLLIEGNPLLMDLVYKKPEIKFHRTDKLYPYTLFFDKQPTGINNFMAPVERLRTDEVISQLRQTTMSKLILTDPKLFVYKEDKLPGTDLIRTSLINEPDLNKIRFADADKFKKDPNKKIVVAKLVISPWTKKASTLLQFSQNMVSSNWYQGGNNNMSVLGVLTGQLNYDNKKNLQFENNLEWRMGFFVVDDSTALRTMNVNNDILKINSKLGLKINGNWYYSGSIDFSTQLLNNYKAVNSNDLKASFLTPIRLNAGVGLDYKYKKLLSLALSPVAFKYIYIHETDETVINPNLFGIEKGENHLSEIGSSFKAILTSTPASNLQVNSTLSFYTNYEKVEIDWEIVGNFTINRFLSTRLSLNPRYDNTVILAKGEKAKIQFKELLTFGFSYKFLN
jgi:hypothetical protein